MTTITAIRAFHGDPVVQATYLNRVDAHYVADEIAHGAYVRGAAYNDNGRPSYCAVGCVLHDPTGGHEQYPEKLGIPTALAYLQDTMFESLPDDDAKEWARAFLYAVPLGADLSGVVPQFMAWLMDDPTYGIANTANDPEIKALAAEVARRYRSGETTGAEADALAEKLRAKARAAWAAREARAAWEAWAARDAWAAWDAWAARDAWYAWDAWDAWYAWEARDAFVNASASELLRLMMDAPVAELAT